MGEKKTLSVKMSKSTVDMLDEEADQLNMSRAQYIRQHLHAGRRLFQSSGKLDTKLLQDFVEGDEAAHHSDDLTTDSDGLADDIRAALPADEDRAMGKDELREELFGTPDEQIERINKTVTYLYERDEIEMEPSSGDYYISQ